MAEISKAGLCTLVVATLMAWGCTENPVVPTVPNPDTSHWSWRHPLPTGDYLIRVTMVDESVGYAVGQVGTVLRTNDGGEHWSSCEYDTRLTLWDAAFIDRDVGVAVGDSGIIIRTSNGGRSWTRVDDFSGRTLACVRFFSRDLHIQWGQILDKGR